ncbi:MAG: glycosyltransferase [Dehalobacterium sp.]
MVPPLISYITFNRLGLTVQSLPSLLESTDDFELHIIDNNSHDGTWEYLQNIKDERIKSKTRFSVNCGQIYALNSNLQRRRKEQYFITLDNDVCIETKDWISHFMKVFDAFPEVGLLGVKGAYPDPENSPPTIAVFADEASYLELVSSSRDSEFSSIPGGCQCLSPKLLEEIGYWNEENCFGDIDLSFRVMHTSMKAGFVPGISISMPQVVECTACTYKDKCQFDKNNQTCFSIYQKLYKNTEFQNKFRWKLVETFKDIETGARPVYCASALDGNSLAEHPFNMEWALENFRFYVNNAN